MSSISVEIYLKREKKRETRSLRDLGEGSGRISTQIL